MVRVGGGGRLLAPLLSFPACLLILSLTRKAYGKAMCSILDQRTAIVDDRLFFCSGNYTFNDDDSLRKTAGFIYWIYLNNTFNVDGVLDMDLVGSAILPDHSLDGGKFPDNGGAAGVFFYDRTTLYPYAGLVGNNAGAVSDTLWAFDSGNNSWYAAPLDGGPMSFRDNSEGVSASDPVTGRSFYTGGWEIAYNGMSNGTIGFQTENPGNPAWTWWVPPGNTMPGPNILKGAMVYVPRGRKGILVAFGGYQTAYPGDEIDDLDSVWDQRYFDDIWIYDIAQNTWFRQAATGELPDRRTEFCAAVSSAPDGSSFQITIHGGWDQLNRRAFNDVWVLSLPSFRWIRVDDTNNPDLRGSDKPGRNRHKCDMWNNNLMIVTGGDITLGEGDTQVLTYTCNTTYPPIKVLDTSTYEWQSEFYPYLTYSVPSVVTDVIGGGPSGGATLLAPEHGWDSKPLGEVFKRAVEIDNYVSPGSGGPAPKGSPDGDNSNNGQSGLNTGAIAGVVVGSVGIVAILAGVICGVFMCRRNQVRGSQVAVEEPTGSVTNIPLVRGWQKAGLGNTTQRYELASENHIHEAHAGDVGSEVHGNDIGRREQTTVGSQVGSQVGDHPFYR